MEIIIKFIVGFKNLCPKGKGQKKCRPPTFNDKRNLRKSLILSHWRLYVLFLSSICINFWSRAADYINNYNNYAIIFQVFMRQQDAPILRQCTTKRWYTIRWRFTVHEKFMCSKGVADCCWYFFVCVAVGDCWFVGTFFLICQQKNQHGGERENFSNEQIFGQNLKEIKDFYA